MYTKQVLHERRRMFDLWSREYWERVEILYLRYCVEEVVAKESFSRLLDLAYIDSLVSSNPYEPKKYYKLIALSSIEHSYNVFRNAITPSSRLISSMTRFFVEQKIRSEEEFKTILESLRSDIVENRYQLGHAYPISDFYFEPDFSNSITYLVQYSMIILYQVKTGDPWESDNFLHSEIDGWDIILTDDAPELSHLILDIQALAKRISYTIPPSGFSSMAKSVINLLATDREATIDLQMLAAVDGLLNRLSSQPGLFETFAEEPYTSILSDSDVRYLCKECPSARKQLRRKVLTAYQYRNNTIPAP